jgi:hypothetical protein
VKSLGLLPFDHLLPGWWMAAYAGLVVAVPLLVLVILALRRRGRRRIWHDWVPLDVNAMPRDFARFGQPWIGRLAYLGFPVIRIMHSPDDADPETVSWLLSNAKERTTGILTGRLSSGGGKPAFSLRLVTFLNDGRILLTAEFSSPPTA